MEYVSTRLEHAIQALRSMLPYANSQDGQLLSEIANNLQAMFLQCSCVIENPHRSRCSQIAIMAVKTPCAVHVDHPGRPKYDIREDTLIDSRSLGFKWNEIAHMLLVSRWTIRRRVAQFGLENISGFSKITDSELDNKVRQFMEEHGSFIGSSMVSGHLKSIGLRVQRHRIRNCLARIDPNNSRIRWAITITRRVYYVPGPNSLWHIGGHHSLITWGFVIHGAIDGYSRLITYLHCLTHLAGNGRKERVKQG